jgi:archaellum component FlaC
VEFERAERHRLSEELRGLEQKLDHYETTASTRFLEFEKQMGEMKNGHPPDCENPATELKSKISEQVDFLSKRIDLTEEKLNAGLYGEIPQQDPGITEMLQKLEQRIIDLDSAAARRNNEESKSATETAASLAELRGALQSVSLRYSEIGDLKKNHLVLMNKVETLQQEMESMKVAVSEPSSEKAHEMETEVLALRAEVRQVLKNTEAFAAAPEIVEELRAMKSDIENGAAQMVELRADFAALKSRVSQVEELLNPIQEQLAALSDSTRNQALQPQDPAQVSLEEDVRTIRENMHEIRTFMQTLSKKL